MQDCTELVVRAQAGDREALGRLVAAVQDDVWHLLLSRCGNAVDAEDAAQETFVQAIASLPTLREPRAFAGWLFRIALDKAKRLKRREAAEPASEPVAKSEADPVEREETRAAVRSAVRGLDETLRTTVDLRYEHGLAYADIARAMDCPEGTVADRLHTAHERLKRALAGAGVAIGMALLESELSAAPRTPAPPRLASRLERLARSPRPSPGGHRSPARLAAAVALLLALGAGLAWRRFGSAGNKPGDGGAGVTAAHDAGAGGSPDRGPAAAAGPAIGASHAGSTSATASAVPAVAVLEGRVRDERTGGDIEGARVWLSAGDENGKAGPSTRTDAGGRYRLEAPPGDYGVHAWAAGFLESEVRRGIEETRHRTAGEETAPPALLVRLEPGGRREQDLSLAAGVTLRGRVVDDRGQAVAGAEVRFSAQTISWDGGGGCTVSYFPDSESDTVRSDLEGKFEIPGIYPKGKAALHIRHDGFEDAQEIVEIRGVDAEVTVTLRAGLEIAGEVVDHLGASVAGATIYIGGSGTGTAFLTAQEAGSDTGGRFRIGDSPRETRFVAAWAPRHGWALAAITADTAGRVRLVLPDASATLKGRVRDAQGQPLAGVQVRISGLDIRADGLRGRLGTGGNVGWRTDDGPDAAGAIRVPVPEWLATTGEEGTFELSRVPLSADGPVNLEFQRDGFQTKEQSVTSDAWLEIVMPAE